MFCSTRIDACSSYEASWARAIYVIAIPRCPSLPPPSELLILQYALYNRRPSSAFIFQFFGSTIPHSQALPPPFELAV